MCFLGLSIYCSWALCLILTTPHAEKDYCSFEFYLFIYLKYFMYMDALLASMCVHHLHAWYPRRPEGIGASGTGYELPSGCWESNLGPLEGEPVLLTTELSLQPSSYAFN